MKRPLISLIAAALLGAVIGPACSAERIARPLTSGQANNVANLLQERILSGYSHTEFKVAPLTVSQLGLGMKKVASKYGAAPIQGMAELVLPENITAARAAELSKQWVEVNFPAFKTRYAAWLMKNGVSTGFFNYTTEALLMTPTGAKKMSVAFNAVVEASGKAIYGNPKVVESDPTILDIQYTPAMVSEDIPAEWNFSEAGTIRYRVLNKAMSPITGWSVVPANGVFDKKLTLDPATGEMVEPDTDMEACFIDSRTPGCPLSNLDVRSVLEQTAATRAFASYINALEPVYKDTGDGVTFIPELSGRVTKRTLSCNSYINEGDYGALLEYSAARYLVEPAPGLLKGMKIQDMVARTITSEKTYSKQVPKSALNGQAANGYIINPLEGDNSLIPLTDSKAIEDFIYIAEVQSGGGVTALPLSGFSGDVPVAEYPGSTSESKKLVFGWQNWTQFTSEKGMQKNFSTSFSLGSLEDVTSFKLTQVNFDDFLLIKLNGTVIFNGPSDKNAKGDIWYSNNWVLAGWGLFPYDTSMGQDVLILNTGITESRCFLDEDSFWYCAEGARKYNDCTPNYGRYHYDSGYEVLSYQCFNVCSSANPVQTRQFPKGKDKGCYPAERGVTNIFRPSPHSSIKPYEIDLKPFLKVGANKLEFSLVVKGAGSFWATTEVSGCGN